MSQDTAKEAFVLGYVTFALAGDGRFEFVDANTEARPPSILLDVDTPLWGKVRVILSVLLTSGQSS